MYVLEEVVVVVVVVVVVLECLDPWVAGTEINRRDENIMKAIRKTGPRDDLKFLFIFLCLSH
jgi:hypothetical protein